ncbi:DUF4826 family protein [Pseudoalteromonas tunicata]|jgi:hypothetical protein|uniref:DUF4826 domain-containing protein n=1 Tax=Pseudoalteromonas tunicata D2 TaxID=87626 RepID=A4CC40_9GAMM|nr:DUF4826 family protein [Pseudoalteromonas tunicata]ATC94476.1 hypothetical protein PTUN_a1919 [Pseudoalteromonas tunicata]AXT30205.1 DUF4826 family protein [Pseudoalteromonas tunicata]EAR27927.1 hypothetical protein PTD2_18935 [Pseudoalteromonas tunicata D2]MDP4983627.1 DUF4826 family protein [Pseudoalteromonas tunicata]
MSEATQEQQLTEQQIANWQRDTLASSQKHLAERGIVPQSIFDKESRYLAPFFAVWKIKAQNGRTYWVIAGRLPTDHAEISAAATAREAIRYFSLQWQLKADQIVHAGVRDKTQLDFANLLINRAHGLYEFYEKDELWANEPK